MIHTWEFRPDGTFEHGWPPNASPTAAAGFEAGIYSVAGPYMNLMVLRRSGAPAGRRNETRRLMYQSRGPAAKDGFVLDGLVLKPKN